MFLHDKILKGFDKGLMTGMILIDLQKAFGVRLKNPILVTEGHQSDVIEIS